MANVADLAILHQNLITNLRALQVLLQAPDASRTPQFYRRHEELCSAASQPLRIIEHLTRTDLPTNHRHHHQQEVYKAFLKANDWPLVCIKLFSKEGITK